MDHSATISCRMAPTPRSSLSRPPSAPSRALAGLRRVARSRIFFVCYVVIATAALLEFGLRAFYATRAGSRVLLYGTAWYRNELVPERLRDLRRAHDDGRRQLEVWEKTMARGSVERHDAGAAGYTKYFPHERKFHFDVDTHEPFPIRINAHGLRGPEYAVKKAPGVTRILTLGASSTFGQERLSSKPSILGRRALTRRSTPSRASLLPGSRSDAFW